MRLVPALFPLQVIIFAGLTNYPHSKEAHMVSRRRFLKIAAAGGAGLAVSRVLGSPSIILKPNVIVLGAGLSGLSAAAVLRKYGCQVTVLEARSRIGGRVFSHAVQGKTPLVVELGAEWVGEDHERIRAMCDEFGITLQDNRFSSRLVYKGDFFDAGKWSFAPKWLQQWENIMKNYPSLTEKEKIRLDRTDWWRYLVRQGISEKDLDIRELQDSTDFGETIRSVSGYAALAEYAESNKSNEMDLKIEGGNGRLVEALADRVGRENIRTGCEALTVRHSELGIFVTCRQGKSTTTFVGDVLVCALPVFAARKIDWFPSLPTETEEAMDALQYARIIKVVAFCDERFWKDESFDMVTDLHGHYFYHATKGQHGPAGALTAYAIGDKADVLSRQNDAFKRRVLVDSLRPAFGDVSKKITKLVSYYWGSDRYTMGAYALYGKGQWFGTMPVLKRPVGRIFFAGEHLADWQGFMEGAIVSGEEAAAAILG
jgi:monoamine oxidase